MADDATGPKLVIFARLPVPGKAKTRLIPALGEEGAARLYARLLNRTMEEARASALPIELRVTGGECAAFRSLYGTDLAIRDQGEGDLGERLARIEGPALVIGSDCPGLIAPVLKAAADALEERSVVIGPATDGGYYLIGFRERCPWLFADMAWSTPTVFAETLARCAARGIGPAILPELADIDTPEDLAAWPELQ
ncbi:TIGR04282 family arsenosugar biosynthesis glycosyltransferase [Qipengyuania sp. XHP0207]|uniref:TIGR04282 family arsenosugar biosynthesis glycosyltransferase n=1 Tax=Qipengyuania sp. XHP0207 TaxID=3038078 RepID=UPI00241C3E45|nr:TIGR04282 family arsenosugar biosynthesis glycosyltransferase [Qipengyuania sp. XHP0207]MDG5747686.1 TIGR04282 family arsenosugar biosynthesis glycosyltransferase [Qipengyuania sp. XHP0207]